MDFALSAPHVEIRRTVRDFAEREILPVADEMERRGEFPTEIIRKAAGLGLLGVPYPESVGGTGLDTLAYAITIEELSRVSGSVGIIVSAHTSLGCAPLFSAGTPEQQERYLRPLASGAKLGAYGLTEAGAGSDSRGTRTRAHRDGDSWVLSGSKRFITNAGVAETYIITAVTDRNADSGKISAFIVEAGTPGFSVGRMEEKMGLHASNTGELLFDDCRIPAENLLGEEGEGDRLFLKTLDGGRIGIGAMALGLAQAAYEAASAYAKQRQQFGRPIASFQGIAFKIADMATQIDAARLMVYRAAWLKDSGEPYSTEAAMAKLFASEVARQVTNDALQVHGGYGYVTEYRVERYLRDAKLTEIGEGTSEIQRMVIARNLLGVRAM
jgi:alkylation response protein AidB-like acyl-CoA dehydrogenase